MKRRELLRLLRKHKPSTSEALENLGLVLDELGAGVFRETYAIRGMNLVVKFPLERYGLFHSRRELRRIKQGLRLTTLRRYMSKLFWADYKSGVIVMQRYYPHAGTRLFRDGQDFILACLYRDGFRSRLPDTYGDNVLRDGNGNLRFVDLGG